MILNLVPLPLLIALMHSKCHRGLCHGESKPASLCDGVSREKIRASSLVNTTAFSENNVIVPYSLCNEWMGITLCHV